MTIGVSCLTAAALVWSIWTCVHAESPDQVREDLDRLLQACAQESSDPERLVAMSGLHLDIGKDVSIEGRARQAAYEEGARLARRALDLQETNADAHYLYAANLGSAAQLKGLAASALTVRELKKHVARALELRPDHPQALHMMGRMLDELPWMLGGDSEAALSYLQQAVAADPHYDHARLDLAKAYLKRKDLHSARRELRTLIETKPASSTASARRFRKEGRVLLDSLKNKHGP